MSPLAFLSLMLLLTAFAAGWQAVKNVKRRRALRELAHQWHMHFVVDDRFHLAARLSARLPVVGAAAVTARDLMYQTEGHRRRYLFTLEFTQGAVIKQRRHKMAAFFEETEAGGAIDGRLVFGDEAHPLLEQYRKLHAAVPSSAELAPP